MINPDGVRRDERTEKWQVWHNGEWVSTWDDYGDAYDSWCRACEGDWPEEDYEARAYDDEEE